MCVSGYCCRLPGDTNSESEIRESLFVQHPNTHFSVVHLSGLVARLPRIELPHQVGSPRSHLLQKLIILECSGTCHLVHGAGHCFPYRRCRLGQCLRERLHVERHPAGRCAGCVAIPIKRCNSEAPPTYENPVTTSSNLPKLQNGSIGRINGPLPRDFRNRGSKRIE